MDKKIIGFGEVMLRLKSPGFERILQSAKFDVTFGGSECNVLVSLANMGMNTGFVTLLPDNELTFAFKKELKGFGVNTDFVLNAPGRFGVYYVEAGSNQRATKVIYDREYSSMALCEKNIDWEKVFENSFWYHISGITPAVSENLCNVALESVNVAKSNNLTVSLDLNYRGKLWKWGKNACEIMPFFAKNAKVIIGTEDDFDLCLGIKGETNKEICEKTIKAFPNIETVAIITVNSKSSDYKDWMASMVHKNSYFESEYYTIYDIVDGIGGGDAFSAGLIYGLNNFKTGKEIIEYATCAGLMKYTFFGDYNLATPDEILSVMKNGGGEISR